MVDSGARERRLMSCLGDPSRFELVTLLLGGDRCVSDLALEVGLSQSCTTRHLQALQREHVVRGERHGKRVMFRLRLDEPEVRTLVAWAISEVAGRRGAPLPSSRRAVHGGDIHVEGLRPGTRAAGSRPKARVRRAKAERRAAGGRAADPAVDAAATEATKENQPLEQMEDRPPAPRRPPRQELEDFLL